MTYEQELEIIKNSNKKYYWSPTYGHEYGEKSERRCDTCQHVCVSTSDIFGQSESCDLGDLHRHLWDNEPNCPKYLECRHGNIKPVAYNAIFLNSPDHTPTKTT
jgi:hypothetical protein